MFWAPQLVFVDHIYYGFRRLWVSTWWKTPSLTDDGAREGTDQRQLWDLASQCWCWRTTDVLDATVLQEVLLLYYRVGTIQNLGAASLFTMLTVLLDRFSALSHLGSMKNIYHQILCDTLRERCCMSTTPSIYWVKGQRSENLQTVLGSFWFDEDQIY